MATIRVARNVSDGLDVDVTLTDGRLHTFHFAAPPVDVQIAVEAAETALLESETATVEVEAENGAII